MSCFSKLNILIYTRLSIFQVLFLCVVNDFFIYLLVHIVFYLFDYMYIDIFFDLNLNFFKLQKCIIYIYI
jgi:hypothetical protein